MFESHLLNLIAKNNYTHVMGMTCTVKECVKYTSKVVKVLEKYLDKVAILSCPIEPSEFTGHVGMHVQILCLPEVHKEVLPLVDCVSF